MKILFLSAAKSIHTVKWVNAFVERGHEVLLVYNRGHEPKVDMINEKLQCHCLKYKGTAGYYLNAKELEKVSKKFMPDVINVHYASGYGTLARRAHLQNYILSIWGSDVYDFPYENKLKNMILKKNISHAKYLASTSNCMARQLREVMEDQSLDITITPFGVDLKKFDPERFEEKDSKEIVIGNIKALEDKYGIRELILVFAALQEEIENHFNIRIKLLIYGGGFQRESLTELIENMHLENSVRLMGRIPNEKVPEALAEMDIFCALSQLDSESFGVSAVEAMAMEKAVVVSDVDGFKEVVTEETGKIVPKKDLKKIESALKELILNEGMRKELGISGRKRVKEFYDWEKNVDTMLSLYAKVKKAGNR